MDKFLTNLAIKIAENVAPIVVEKIVQVLPLLASAVGAAVIRELLKSNLLPPSLADGLQAHDVPELAGDIRDVLDKLIPDIDFPLIGDLTDFWRPQKPPSTP